MMEQFGPDKVVMITISNVSENDRTRVSSQVRDAAGAESISSMGTGSGLIITLAPVEDVAALAKELRLGKVTNVDPIKRKITIEGDGSY